MRQQKHNQDERGCYQRRDQFTGEDISAAYYQGRRDHAAGRSIASPRYADAKRDEAWRRGQIDAMKAGK